MAKHALISDDELDICDRNPEYCTLGYKHYGPCPPGPSKVDTSPAEKEAKQSPANLVKKGQEERLKRLKK